MCIFNASVVRVADTQVCVDLFFVAAVVLFFLPVTQILVVPLKGGRQLVVYANEVSTKHPNAMILPVPLTKGEKIVPVDLSGYDDVFTDWCCFVQCVFFRFSSFSQCHVLQKQSGSRSAIKLAIQVKRVQVGSHSSWELQDVGGRKYQRFASY
jgi:hypothetical protein